MHAAGFVEIRDVVGRPRLTAHGNDPGAELLDVVVLAAEFPASHEKHLCAPVFPSRGDPR